jgi:hypothetical protein
LHPNSHGEPIQRVFGTPKASSTVIDEPKLNDFIAQSYPPFQKIQKYINRLFSAVLALQETTSNSAIVHRRAGYMRVAVLDPNAVADAHALFATCTRPLSLTDDEVTLQPAGDF